MAKSVGEYLKFDHRKLRFATIQLNNGLPGQIVKRELDTLVAAIVSPYITARKPPVLLYDLSGTIQEDPNPTRDLMIIWMSSHNNEEGIYLPALPKDATIHRLRVYLSHRVKPGGVRAASIRIFSVSKDRRRQYEYLSPLTIEDISPEAELYAEVGTFQFMADTFSLFALRCELNIRQEKSESELVVSRKEEIINVCHWDCNLGQAFGVPFTCVLKSVGTFFNSSIPLLVCDQTKRLSTDQST